MANPQSKALITSCIRKRIGNGLDSFFWHDTWIGEVPLKVRCPRLYLIANSKNATVAENCFWDGLGWKWTLIWRRNLRPQDMVEHQALHQSLSQVHLSPQDEDSFSWSPHKKGWFSVKSFCFELAKSDAHCPNSVVPGIWRGLVPHRVEIFTWLALLRKLNTKDRLVRLGIIDVALSHCVFCNASQESCDHIFLQCPMAWSLWSWWLSVWNVHWSFPSSPREAFDQWTPPKKGRFFKKIWAASFLIIMWTLWKERNSRCFENNFSSLAQLQDLVILRLCWWIKGWDDPFPYGPNEVLIYPQCLDWSSAVSSSHIPKAPVSWSPPDPSCYKWNVDASLKLSCSKSAIRGVLRDCHGRFLCLFSSPIPFMEINHAEMFAIQRAIKLSSSIGCLSGAKMMVESDSLNAVSWCNGNADGPWNLNFVINFIRNAMRCDSGIEITYKSRESNVVADLLAKQGLSRADEFVAWL
ncbi:uncharacterized protein LOC125498510 [Beta vulgaris subsp. vulgaris]|uniref:uncharacterized protein LOC125498510 n=1 Tax=Beta vulgaris subsp. vulgaris TaxID=3555 RepID=UPI00203695B3|nr:uncharacterized protein LOC125498510 [Beta vulgaris subsp. vulgaris]